MTSSSPSGKNFFAKMIQKSRNAELCDAPDLIPDDVFYMNFDCTKEAKKTDLVDSCKSSPMAKTKSS